MCCKDNCLSKIDHDNLLEHVAEIQKMTNSMNQSEKTGYFRYVLNKVCFSFLIISSFSAAVESCFSHLSPKGYAMMKYKIGKNTKVEVCRQAFRYTYNMRRDRLRIIAKDYKEGRKGNSQRQVTTTPPFDLTINKNQELHHNMCLVFGLDPTKEQESAMLIPNSQVVFVCWAWMNRYFSTVGDFEPNSDNEIHLEPTTVQEIWKIYDKDISPDGKVKTLNVNQFGQLWNKCFR